MAVMIPQNAVSSSDAVIKFYQSIHHQLGPDYKIRQCLKSPSELKGTLLWVQYHSQSLFIYLCELTAGELKIDKTKKQPSLKEQIINSSEVNKVISYQKSLLPEEFQKFHVQLTPFIIIHSQIPEGMLNLKLKSLGISLLGQEVLLESDLKNVLHKFMGGQHSKEIQKHIQKIFSPETQTIHHNKYYLLDKEQELAIKSDIDLNDKNKQPSNCNLCGVNGGSSSGKSEVILQRVKLLKYLNPEQSILILSANMISNRGLSKRFMDFSSSGADKNFHFLSFYEWCQNELSLTQKLVNEDEIAGLVINVVRKYLQESNISQLVFLREMNYIYGRDIKDEAAYLRNRKATQLSKQQHENIWTALKSLEKVLQSNNKMLLANLPSILCKAIKDGKSIKQYDHILLDDAHHFPPIAFELIKQALTPTTGQLFISQDPRQGIMNPISLWKDTGLDLRGKSTRLLNNYQTNPYVLNAANAFYMSRLPDDTDKVIQFNFIKDKSFKKPQLLHFNDIRDEENRLLNEIRVLIQNDINLEDILLIGCNSKTCEHLAELIQQTLGVTTALRSDSHREIKALRLSTLEQSQGLKVPYVFIFGLEEVFGKDDDKGKEITNIDTDDYYEAIYIENTRKLNMAMTTAQKELTLFLHANIIPDELVSPHIQIPTTDNEFLAEVHQLKA